MRAKRRLKRVFEKIAERCRKEVPDEQVSARVWRYKVFKSFLTLCDIAPHEPLSRKHSEHALLTVDPKLDYERWGFNGPETSVITGIMVKRTDPRIRRIIGEELGQFAQSYFPPLKIGIKVEQ